MSKAVSIVIIIGIILGFIAFMAYLGYVQDKDEQRPVQQLTTPDNITTVLDSILQRLDIIEGKLNITEEPQEPPTPSCPTDYAWNGTSCVPITPIPEPPKPVCKDNEFYNETTDTCQVKPPEQPPVVNITGKTVVMLGDVDGTTAGKSVFNKVSAERPDLVIVLGDLGYDSNLDWFKSTYGTFGNRLACVIGNHDSSEDGGSTVIQQALQYCANDYYIKMDRTLFIGVNTNGDLNAQLGKAQLLFKDSSVMQGIKSVHLVSHKPCATPSNSHHGVESNVKAFCDKFFASVPAGIEKYADNAHNHNLAEGASNGISYHTSGAGGRSHYECGTISGIWQFCNDNSYGYLKYTIAADGTTADQFIDYNGKVLN